MTSARLWIEVLGTDLAPAELPQKGVLAIGSSPDRAGLVFEGQGVEGVHCAIGRIKGGGWALKDMGSEFGTIVNGKRVESARLSAGDTVIVGSRRLRVFDPNAPADADPAEPALEPAISSAPENSRPVPRSDGNGASAEPKDTPEVTGYKVLRQLGRGSSGIVYLAIQESLDRKVALKVLAPRLASDRDFVRQFQDEARAAAALNNPNVVTVYDVGQDGEHHYLSMEYMSCGCLESRVSTLGPVAWNEVKDILRDAAAGLVYAESRGIVHRDIKPANLMQNEQGVTKIADLGLATMEQAEMDAEGRKLHGTPHFLAPELVRGAKPDPRSDLYALGATAYRLLTGHTPYEGNSAKEILRRALHEDFQSLASWQLTDLPEEGAALVERMLAKDPGDRPPSAETVLDHIDRLETGAAAHTPGVYKRRRWPKIAASLFLVVAAAGIAGTAWQKLGIQSPADGDPGSVVQGAGTQTDPSEDDPLNLAINVTDVDPNESADPEDDTAARLFEAQARVALLELSDREMPDAERITALRTLADQYLGSEAANSALERARGIEQRLLSESASREARAGEVATLLGALRSVSGIDREDGPPPQPAVALAAMHGLPGQEILAGVREFEQGRAALIGELLDAAVAHVTGENQRAETQKTQGDFDAVRTTLTEVAAYIDLDDSFPLDGLPDSAAQTARRLIDAKAAARQRITGLATEQRTYLVDVRRQEQTRLREGFGGAAGLESELKQLDFAAAESRIRNTAASLSAGDLRQPLEDLRADLELARGARTALIKAWAAGTWRRMTIIHPRTGRGERAVGVDAQGILIEGDASPTRLPWSLWGGRPEALHQLFKERLDRDYQPDELRGIGALLRLAAVINTVDVGSQVLQPAAAHFSDTDSQNLLDAFRHAREWSRLAGDEDRTSDELAAAETLARALSAASDGRASHAVTELERLLDDHQTSLIVLLLSDGSEWRESTPELDDAVPSEDAPSDGAEVGDPSDASDPSDSEERDGAAEEGD